MLKIQITLSLLALSIGASINARPTSSPLQLGYIATKADTHSTTAPRRSYGQVDTYIRNGEYRHYTTPPQLEVTTTTWVRPSDNASTVTVRYREFRTD